MVYTIPNPYFNFFYIPITAMGAEVANNTIKSKYLGFIYTVIGSIISVFLFDLTISYPILFLFFVFFYSILLYMIALYWVKNLFAPVPLILSLAIYSLVYGQVSTDFYVALNNSLFTLIAMVVIVGALILFPQSYYYRCWLRSFILLLKQILNNFYLIKQNEEVKIEPVQGHLMHVVKYANLLPRKMPTFTILKINLILNEVRLSSCVVDQKQFKISSNETETMIAGLKRLITAAEHEKACTIEPEYNYLLAKLITTWNTLCIRL